MRQTNSNSNQEPETTTKDNPKNSKRSKQSKDKA